jgi:phage-related protein
MLRSVVIQIWRLPTNVFRMLRSVVVQIYEMLRSVVVQICEMLRSVVIQIWRLLTNVFEMLKSVQTNGWRNGSVRWASMVLTAC